jgi:hypothetical protein
MLAGCPGGGELEQPEKYFPKDAGIGPVEGGTLMVACDYAAALETCAKVGCHKPLGSSVIAGLNLVPDDGLVSRLKDVPATFADIWCVNMACTTIPTACPTGALLVDSKDPEQSFLVRKLNDPLECGDKMPPPGYAFSEDQRACLELMVQAIAELP